MAGSLFSVLVAVNCCIRLCGNIPVADITVGLNITSSSPYVHLFLFIFLLLFLLFFLCCLVTWGPFTLRGSQLQIVILKWKINIDVCNFNLHKCEHSCWTSEFLQMFIYRLLNATKSTVQAMQHYKFTGNVKILCGTSLGKIMKMQNYENYT
jgi:hypothetical protein